MAFNKETNKNYLANKSYGPQSSGQVNFKEAVPKYAQRVDSETTITATGISEGVGKSDTNAQITIGKDRWPEDPVKSESAKAPNSKGQMLDSGYASYHNAGAIDLVVGRCAPYPVEISGGGHMSPLYNTVKSKTIEGQVEDLFDGTRHTGVIMDAARIYMSQMCKVDKYFKLEQADKIYANNGASSGIVAKADRIRLHARRDVYIHAGGDKDTSYDSCGYSFLDSPKIHLMVGNGELNDDSYMEDGKRKGVTRTTVEDTNLDTETGRRTYRTVTQKVKTGKARQQPVPRGDNLAMFLDELLDTIKDSFEVINNVLIEQNKLNQLFANHIHGTAVGLTTQCPVSQVGNAISTAQYARCMISAFQAVYNNIPALKMNYLKKSGFKYINSRNVTVT